MIEILKCLLTLDLLGFNLIAILLITCAIIDKRF